MISTDDPDFQSMLDLAVATVDAPPIAVELYRRLGPWFQMDVMSPSQGWPLLAFCKAFFGGMQDIEDIIRDTDDGPGWSSIMDPDRAPVEWLPWLGQFVGVSWPANTSEQTQRDLIKGTPGFKRGTPAALVDAVRAELTGTKTVYLIERQGSAWALGVTTLTSETPSAARVAAAIRSQKPAGIVVTQTAITGGDYATLAATHTDYTDIFTTYTTYAQIPTNPSL